jgi:hypothetical protein
MTDTIKSIIKAGGLLICPACDGEGEVGYFCGHETTTLCYLCAGHGVIRSTKKQKHSKKCNICHGRKGGCGGCNSHPKGLIEWESYELFDANTKDHQREASGESDCS